MSSPKSSKYEFLQVLDESGGSEKIFQLNLSSNENQLNRLTTEFFKISEDQFKQTIEDEEVGDEESELRTKEPLDSHIQPVKQN